jgi:hypothetical protein
MGAGSFVISGESMTPLVDYRIAPEAGSFTLTGQDVTLSTTAGSGTARQFAAPNSYINTDTTSRSFAAFESYLVA